ncbi:hypothetical protein CCO03_04820 [Comamonas serinivorans]|uniref:IPTL-CTERM protein sorting domain-containing protein n=1 Tax=Comamonas serinivorans TaxID=1082851 RepID=A0A1Y0EKI7_9BURK|nr:hypothetical protein CCO03_04820 [Comamonas serinivorans]
MVIGAWLAGSAAAAVVTTPAGVLVGPAGDAPVAEVWQRTNVRVGSSAGITADYPNASTASGLLTSDSVNGKADWQYLAATPLGPLSSFRSATYQWYRDGASTVAGHFSPLLRMLVDVDGNPATTDLAWVIYERGAIDAVTPVPTDTWVTETIDGDTRVWVHQVGSTNNQVPYTRMADFAAGTHVPEAGGTQITGASLILGLQAGIGSGWDGVFRGAVDHIGLVAQRSLGPDNFELAPPPPSPAPAAVPAASWWSLLGLGSLLVCWGAWRRRRA